ncbi:MAG TPA: SRPBCC family protein [Chitinophagaceae bacterium]|nr:SRPBCC family protein [Chitinophagaceae bacterium]
MRYVKLLLLSFVLLFALVTVISLFIPSRVRISKAINIKEDKVRALDQVSNAVNWKNWYPGIEKTKPLYVEGVIKGAIFDSSSATRQVYLLLDQVKQGEVTAMFVGSRMRPVSNVWKTVTYSNSDSTTLQWYMDFDLRWYPWEKFASLLLEQSYGPRMEQGLSNLKRIVESDTATKD